MNLLIFLYYFSHNFYLCLDRLFYIYTSGTTGLPKAAIIKHNRYAFFGMGLKNILKIRSDDVIYTALPLYHQAAGTLGTSQCIIGGTTMAIRSKFSASKFWDDCIKYDCTVRGKVFQQ